MSKKTKVLVFILLIVLIALGGTYYYFNKQNKDTTLTVVEEQWIDQNKNRVFDISITNDTPVFNFNGKGIFFDYLNKLESVTGLHFNKSSINSDTVIENSYSLSVKDELNSEDVLIYEDYSVLVTKTKDFYYSGSEIKNLVIGTLESDADTISSYFTDSYNVTFKSYTDLNSLYQGLEYEEVNGIVINRLNSLDHILSNDLFISYQIPEKSYYYVLTLGEEEKLNNIMKKYFNKWYKENFISSYHDNLLISYFDFNSIDEATKAKFQSKTYDYGFVNSIPFNLEYSGKHMGINDEVLTSFQNFSKTDIKFKKYKNINDLKTGFNSNEFDFMFSVSGTEEYDVEIKDTISIYSNELIITSDLSNNLNINSLQGLNGIEVMTVKGSIISEILFKNNAKIKEYDNIEKLISDINTNSIIALDSETYEYNIRKTINNFKIDYKTNINQSYNFIIKDTEENKIFLNVFDFYLSMIPKEEIINNVYINLLSIKEQSTLINKILILATMLIGIFGLIFAFFKYFPTIKRRKKTLSKEEKLRYIDVLTSLKNRNYLNDNIETWDSSDVYPQTIVVVDLNNIAYINDNYGHSEGDAVIVEASDILLKNQKPDTEIIRTNGNEFLVYFVGYEEKEIKEYVKKIYKELKTLTHGFGSAVGYSMIIDPIKTIDDAINEATIDMRNNKEGIDE